MFFEGLEGRGAKVARAGFGGVDGEFGWARVSFSGGREEVQQAVRRMEGIFLANM